MSIPKLHQAFSPNYVVNVLWAQD